MCTYKRNCFGNHYREERFLSRTYFTNSLNPEEVFSFITTQSVDDSLPRPHTRVVTFLGKTVRVLSGTPDPVYRSSDARFFDPFQCLSDPTDRFSPILRTGPRRVRVGGVKRYLYVKSIIDNRTTLSWKEKRNQLNCPKLSEC